MRYVGKRSRFSEHAGNFNWYVTLRASRRARLFFMRKCEPGNPWPQNHHAGICRTKSLTRVRKHGPSNRKRTRKWHTGGSAQLLFHCSATECCGAPNSARAHRAKPCTRLRPPRGTVSFYAQSSSAFFNPCRLRCLQDKTACLKSSFVLFI